MSRSVCHAPSITHSLTLAAGLHQVISGGYKLALHYSPGTRLSLPFIHASLSSYSPAYNPGFPILPVPDYDSCLVLLDLRSLVSCPGFPILPVPDYDSCLVVLDLLSPVSCSRSCLSQTPSFASALPKSVRLPPVPDPRSRQFLVTVDYFLLLLGPTLTRYK